MSLVPSGQVDTECTPHFPFARYYLRALSEPADRSVPREAQFSRLMLRNTHMTDEDMGRLCAALTRSYEDNGATNCSLSLLEEIDVSENPSLSSAGLQLLFETLRHISVVERAVSPMNTRRSPAARHLQAMAVVSSVEQSECSRGGMDGQVEGGDHDCPTTPISLKSGDACNALWRVDARQSSPLSNARTNRALATAVVQFLRISRALFDVNLPLGDEEEKHRLESAEASERAARRTELILKRIVAASELEVIPTPHPLDDRALFWFDDVPMNAEVNRFPMVMKERVLAAMIRHSTDALSLMGASRMDLSEPCSVDDIHRTHPKHYGVASAEFLSNILSETSLVTMVDVSNNNKGDDATRALSSFLKANRSVVDLRLRSNGISTEGGLALAEALNGNHTLIELDLADNSCSDVVAAAFRDLIVLNTSRVGFVNWDRNCVSPHLVADANYQLMLNTQPRLVKETVVRLTQKDPQFTRVMWNSAEPIITDNTLKVLMQSIRGNDVVTHIDISNSKITDEGAKYLADIITYCPNLRTVVAQFNYIGDEGALLLLHALPMSKRLERLDLKHQQPRGISALILNSIEQISNLGNQPYAIRKHGLALVVNDPSCTEVDLSVYDGERRITDETVKILVNLMGTNTSVRVLNLSNNRFRVTGASIPLVASIAKHLTVLDLSCLHLRDDDVIGPLGVGLLGLQPSPALRELNLANNELTRASSYELAIIARNDNDTIQTINFDGNAAISNQDKDVVEFYCGVNRYPKAFKNIILDIEANEKPQLTSLNFTVVERTAQQGTSHRFSKEFDDHSVRLICIALAQNSTVHKVIFSGNRCTDVGATYWAQLLRVNVSIHHLDLSFNEIGVEGLTEIAEALEDSHAVKVFGFEGNPGAKDPLISRRLLSAVRRSALESSSDRSQTYVTAHSVSNTHHARALQLSMAQAAVVDKQLEDAIMAEAMAEYKAKKATATYRRQQELIAASQLTRAKDASVGLLPLTVGSYKDGIDCVPKYVVRAGASQEDHIDESRLPPIGSRPATGLGQ